MILGQGQKYLKQEVYLNLEIFSSKHSTLHDSDMRLCEAFVLGRKKLGWEFCSIFTFFSAEIGCACKIEVDCNIAIAPVFRTFDTVLQRKDQIQDHGR